MKSKETMSWQVSEHCLQINSTQPLRALSSAIVGGGWQQIQHIFNVDVGMEYESTVPTQDMENICKSFGAEPKHSVGLMTAVDVEQYCFLEEEYENQWVRVWVTVGVTNAAEAGSVSKEEQVDYACTPGTINTIIITNAALSEGAFVNGVMLAVEAKAAALREYQVLDVFKGAVATGTTSDAIVFASTMTGPTVAYTGMATHFGQLMSRVVRRAIGLGIEKQMAAWEKDVRDKN
ncbi:MAG: adenosylcobinamide amidohydrolase [Clostridia bacterium]